jgi:hypothetical protein
MQALAAAMRKLQEEWWVLVVQLEHQLKLGQLNLAALLYYCQAPAASLSLLANIAVSAWQLAPEDAGFSNQHQTVYQTIGIPAPITCLGWVADAHQKHHLYIDLVIFPAPRCYLFCCAVLCVAKRSSQGEAAAKADLTSASLLNLLVSRQRSLAGDRAGQQLVGQLLEAAAEPYFGILRQWMCAGVLDDPYGEFMVKVGGVAAVRSCTYLGGTQ